jgi:PEGA domain
VIARHLLLGAAEVPAQNPPPSRSIVSASRQSPVGAPEKIVTTLPPTVGNARKAAVATNGRLVIRSEPAGAQVVINGRSYGLTPVSLTNVIPGEHDIVLKRDGAELRQTVRVEAGATVTMVAPLKTDSRASGWVAIDSPIELDVFEGGALLGTSRSRQIMVQAGTHTLQLVNEPFGFQHTQQVRVESGKVEWIAVALPQTMIHLNATPWAEVWIDGKSVGETPIGNLPIAIGPHEVVFRHPEFGDKVISAVVKAGVPTRLTADLRR